MILALLPIIYIDEERSNGVYHNKTKPVESQATGNGRGEGES
jgi:hypothetical protein